MQNNSNKILLPAILIGALAGAIAGLKIALLIKLLPRIMPLLMKHGMNFMINMCEEAGIEPPCAYFINKKLPQ
ncbi:MAG: hypothetical protein GF398_03380 [Chitinivibrionales bacterium]|nr:hypothetical protein [Chitinivibrionales bacterium]